MSRLPGFKPLTLALIALTGLPACKSNNPPEAPGQTPSSVAPATVTLPPPATQAEKDQAYLQFAQINLMASMADRCNWLGDMEKLAVNAALKEREAWIQWQQLDMKQATQTANDLRAKNAHIVCDSAEGKQYREGIAYGAWQMRSSWAIRGYSLLPGTDQPDWYAGKSRVAQHRAALDAAIAGLKGISANAIDVSLERFRGEAAALLAVRCKTQDKQCPVFKADAGYRTYAQQVLVQTEAYAAALEHAQDKTGAPPK